MTTIIPRRAPVTATAHVQLLSTISGLGPLRDEETASCRLDITGDLVTVIEGAPYRDALGVLLAGRPMRAVRVVDHSTLTLAYVDHDREFALTHVDPAFIVRYVRRRHESVMLASERAYDASLATASQRRVSYLARVLSTIGTGDLPVDMHHEVLSLFGRVSDHLRTLSGESEALPGETVAAKSLN